jgi:hypothetical protein
LLIIYDALGDIELSFIHDSIGSEFPDSSLFMDSTIDLTSATAWI